MTDFRPDRREFFQSLAGRLADGARKRHGGLLTALGDDATRADDNRSRRRRRPRMARAGHVERTAQLDELRELVAAHGLEHRLEDVERLARTSARLLVGEADSNAGSRFGGKPDLPAAATWPEWHGQRLDLLLQLDLEELTAAGFTGALPRTGALFVFYARADRPTGLSPDQRGACVALVAEPGPRQEAAGAARGIELSVQLVLPRAWAAPVVALALDVEEEQAWERMRADLARLQGVDADEPAAGKRCLHRIGGYPDDTRGGMQLICDRVTAGADLEAGEPTAADGDERAAVARWDLLFQLSADDLLGWSWGDSSRERLYVWQRGGGLGQGPLDAWALAR